MIQQMLAIWYLVPLPFLNPAYTYGSSWFTYCQSLAWRILRINLLTCKIGDDLKEAEQVKKRWQEYTELYKKKSLSDPDNQNGVVIHLEPDILEYEVKWAFSSVQFSRSALLQTRLVEMMKFQVAYFKTLKGDAAKMLHSICQQIWEISCGHKTANFSFHSSPKEG